MGYVDGIYHSIKLIEASQEERLEIKRLEQMISNKEVKEQSLINELEEKGNLLEQLMREIDRMDDKVESLTKEIESSNQINKTLRMNLSDKDQKIEAMTSEVIDRNSQLKILINKMSGRYSKTETPTTGRKGQADIWMGEHSEQQPDAKALMGQANSKADNLTKELELRDKWIQLLRIKLKTTAHQREDFDEELKKVKSSFLYRLIK